VHISLYHTTNYTNLSLVLHYPPGVLQVVITCPYMV